MTAPPVNGSRPRLGSSGNRQELPKLEEFPSAGSEQGRAPHQETEVAPAAPKSTGARMTRRVRKLHGRLGELHGFAEVQNDPAWTSTDTPRVIRQRQKAAESKRLHDLLRDPARRALSTARWRRAITIATGLGLVLSLSVSTANVQNNVANGAPEGSGQWWFAWTVEPSIAILLLSLFAYRAFMATRGEHVADKWILNTEIALLAVTFTLQTWRQLHWPWSEQFDLLQLVSHGVWPFLAVLIVTCVPRIWAGFGDLDHGGKPADPDLVNRLETVRELIAAGELPITPSRSAIEKALRERGTKTNTQMAQRIHRCLTGRTELL